MVFTLRWAAHSCGSIWLAEASSKSAKSTFSQATRYLAGGQQVRVAWAGGWGTDSCSRAASSAAEALLSARVVSWSSTARARLRGSVSMCGGGRGGCSCLRSWWVCVAMLQVEAGPARVLGDATVGARSDAGTGRETAGGVAGLLHGGTMRFMPQQGTSSERQANGTRGTNGGGRGRRRRWWATGGEGAGKTQKEQRLGRASSGQRASRAAACACAEGGSAPGRPGCAVLAHGGPSPPLTALALAACVPLTHHRSVCHSQVLLCGRRLHSSPRTLPSDCLPFPSSTSPTLHLPSRYIPRLSTPHRPSPNMGLKRSRSDSLPSSDLPASLVPRAHSVEVKLVHLDLDAAARPAVMKCSLPPHGPLTFASFEAYDVHYQQTHMNRCSDCQRNFPDAHFLGLHIAENHDPIRAARRDRGEKTVGPFTPIAPSPMVCVHPLDTPLLESCATLVLAGHLLRVQLADCRTPVCLPRSLLRSPLLNAPQAAPALHR